MAANSRHLQCDQTERQDYVKEDFLLLRLHFFELAFSRVILLFFEFANGRYH